MSYAIALMVGTCFFSLLFFVLSQEFKKESLTLIKTSEGVVIRKYNSLILGIYYLFLLMTSLFIIIIPSTIQLLNKEYTVGVDIINFFGTIQEVSYWVFGIFALFIVMSFIKKAFETPLDMNKQK